MRKRALVVGGGLAGLACGHRLKQLGADVTVLEAAERAGGVVRTTRAGAFSVEWGAQTCIVEPGLRALAGELGLTLVPPATKADRRRYLVRAGKLVGPFGAISPGGIIRMLWGMIRKGAPAAEDESVEHYARRRFGDEAARRMFDPLVSGIFAGDPARLSYASALARFGKRRGETATFAGGMGALPAALAGALGPALRLNARVVSISRARPELGPAESKGWSVRLASGETLEADDVVLTSPAHASADLVAALDAPLAAELRAIRYAPVTAVLLGYDASAFPAGAPRG
ncbi:MAG TPA: FAD-dependent oxidoreductase, partial [Planctomycetota bacterium]|nr:FAD-dependent oxidoreductase [Planctomycetota bacterium]